MARGGGCERRFQGGRAKGAYVRDAGVVRGSVADDPDEVTDVGDLLGDEGRFCGVVSEAEEVVEDEIDEYGCENELHGYESESETSPHCAAKRKSQGSTTGPQTMSREFRNN